MNYKRIFLYVLVISLSVSVWLSSGCDKHSIRGNFDMNMYWIANIAT